MKLVQLDAFKARDAGRDVESPTPRPPPAEQDTQEAERKQPHNAPKQAEEERSSRQHVEQEQETSQRFEESQDNGPGSKSEPKPDVDISDQRRREENSEQLGSSLARLDDKR